MAPLNPASAAWRRNVSGPRRWTRLNEVMAASGICLSLTSDKAAIRRTQPNTSSSLRPRARARVYEAWMTGPSAMGSL